MNDKASPGKQEEPSLPSRRQMIALVLSRVEDQLKDLMQLRENDDGWDDVDVDIDYTISLAHTQVQRMLATQFDHKQDGVDFGWPWLMVAASINMAVKLFSRRNCRYWRALNRLRDCFVPLHDLVEHTTG